MPGAQVAFLPGPRVCCAFAGGGGGGISTAALVEGGRSCNGVVRLPSTTPTIKC